MNDKIHVASEKGLSAAFLEFKAVVDNYLTSGESPIKAINNLMRVWLSGSDLSDDHKKAVETLLQLVDTLTELQINREKSSSDLPAPGAKAKREPAELPDHGQYSQLHGTIREYMDTYGPGETVTLLKEMYAGWSLYHFGSEDYRDSPMINTSRERLGQIFSLMELMSFVVDLGDHWEAVEQLELSTDHQSNEEVSR